MKRQHWKSSSSGGHRASSAFASPASGWPRARKLAAWFVPAAVPLALGWAVVHAPRPAGTLAALLAAAFVLEFVAPDAIRVGRRILGPGLCVSLAAFLLVGPAGAVLAGCARGIGRAVSRSQPIDASARTMEWSVLAPLAAALAAAAVGRLHFAAGSVPLHVDGSTAAAACIFLLSYAALQWWLGETRAAADWAPGDAARGFSPWFAVQYALTGCVGFALAQELSLGNLFVLPFLVFPIALVRLGTGRAGLGAQRYIAALERENDALLNQTGQFDRANGDLIEALGIAVDEQEGAERGRTRRIADIATRIGAALGVSGWKLELLRRGALLHDVGVLAVPAGKRTQAHCEMGARLVAGWRHGRTISQIIEQHHERLDGTGYPRGLHADEIILEARIVAVAEAFVSLTSAPGRAGGLEAIADIEGREAGEFDPLVVKALSQAVELRTAEVLPMVRRQR
ncbi:MAG: hypothetical protein DLM53_09875 [Candidatus Eremiobacter antarcticus]|nr:MAG: hypothetical protein DLM53_09875 [Candidatus Eremiobacter sp. RRmetagenome_bin22]